MAYEGYEVPIALGSLGLQTDGPQSQLPPNAAIIANNVSFFTGTLSKSPGTALYTTHYLGAPTAIMAAIDWWPTPTVQRMIAMTSDGKVWRDTGDGTFTTQTPLKINETQFITFSAIPASGSITFEWNSVSAGSGLAITAATTAAQVQTNLRTITGLGSCTVTGVVSVGAVVMGFTVVIPGTNSSQPLITSSANTLEDAGTNAVSITVTHILAGATNLGTITASTVLVPAGAEVQGNARRLFIYTGVSQLAMITGDGTAVTAVNRPAADWSTQFPTFGLVYNNRHLAFMNHNIYFSRLGDHTDFTTGEADGTEGSVYPVYPGEGDGIIGATVFKGALLVFKRPFGVYLVQWNGQDLNTAGNVQITRISDSFAIASPHAATQLLNDLIGGSASGSIFSQSATNAFGSLEAGDLLQQAAVRNYFRQNFAYGGIPRMHSAYYTDKIIGMFTGVDNAANTQNRILMYDSAGQSPRISVETKDQPNCLFMRKDTNFVPRPFYGSADGNIYQMDQSVASVNGVAYTGEFQTPYIDFSFLDPKLSEKTKLFDFLSVTYENLGNWAFYVDVYVDGSFIQTLTFNMKQSSSTLDNFVLDKDTLGGSLATLTLRQPLKSCSGKAISFRIYNGLLNQTFTVERLIVSFRESGEQNRSSK